MSLPGLDSQQTTRELADLVLSMLAPPPKLTVSQWADRYRRLSSESSAEPGRWSTSRAEFQREIMDAISDPSVLEVWCKKSAQIGWTEILCNAVGYYIDQDPSPMLLMQPTLDMAETWSKDRLAPMLRDTPRLRGKVKDVRSRDSGNTILHKQFAGGHLTAAGANSAASLSSRPVRCFFGDEVNRYPTSAGTEGDPIKLGQKRTNNFWNRRFLAGSTPTTKGASRVSAGYAKSDQRRYFVPCPHCSEMQALEWRRVKWPEGRPEDAYYECAACGASIDDSERAEMIRRGEWRATKPFKGVAGFHIWEAYSPWRRLSEIVADFLEAKPFPELLKVWVNTSLGEDWEDQGGERMIADELASRAEEYEAWTVPDGAVFATAGSDVQHDRIEVGVYAYGPGEECWTVAHEVIYGAPTDPRLWQQHDDLLGKMIRRADGMAIPILACCIDAGDGATTGFVLDYARSRRQRGVLAIKGQSQPGKPPIGKPAKVDVNIRGVAVHRGAELWPVGSDTIKGILMARLKDEGFIHFPADLPASYYEQLAAERLVTKFRNGIPHKVWTKDAQQRNEALDCIVYAYAAACFVGLKRANWTLLRGRLKPWRVERAPPAPTVTLQPETFVPRPPPVKRRSVGLGSEDWNL